MAFSLFGLFRSSRTQHVPAAACAADPGRTSAVVRKTLPTRRLIDRHNPHRYVPSTVQDVMKKF
jgi:hypothetical protein